MAKNFYDSPWSWIAALLTGIPFPAFKDAVTDEYGANSVDREYVAYLKRMVENGEITEEDARAKLAAKYDGKGTSDEFYDSVGSDVGKGIEIGTGSAGAATGIAGVLQSLIAYYTRNELTGAEREMNEFSAGEAQKSREFTEYMARNKYSMETASMQDAGVNPAMVYGGGNLVPTAANGAAATSSSIGAGSIADLLGTMVRMPLEMKRLNAEIENTRANAALTRQKTETEKFETRIRGINADYQDALNSQTIDNLKATYDNLIADTDKKTADRDYVLTQKDAQVTLNKYIDERQREEINQIKGNISKMSAEKKKTDAEKTYQDWYNGFVQQNNFLPSSNDALMIATYVASLFGIEKGDVTGWVHDLFDSSEDGEDLLHVYSASYKKQMREGKGGHVHPNQNSGAVKSYEGSAGAGSR